MTNLIRIVTMLLFGWMLGSCEPHAHYSTSLGGPAEIVPTSARIYIPVPTETAAWTAVAGALRYAPTGKFYVLDSTRVRYVGDYWQVLVLRNDSTGHRLAYICFDVEKNTGNVQCLGPLR
jgi:hypothetical protein